MERAGGGDQIGLVEIDKDDALVSWLVGVGWRRATGWEH
jgi:hypothetical protein